MKLKGLLSFTLLAFIFTACSPNIEDAKKLGFDSIEQMKEFQSKGFKTKQDFIDNQDSIRLGFPNVQLWLKAKSEGFKDFAEYQMSLKQNEVEEALNLFKQEWNAADGRKNEFAVNAVEDKFRLYKNELFKEPLQARKWSCSVDRVWSSESLTCVSGIVEYKLKFDRPSPQQMQQLSAGMSIKFSGGIVKETSWTTSGAIRRPEFEVLNAQVFLSKKN